LSIYLTSQQVRQVIPKIYSDPYEIALMIGASKLEALLKDEQAASKRSQERILRLENELQQRSVKIAELSRSEKMFEERCREKVRSTIHGGYGRSL
jgi:hypothetical protein